MLQWVTVISLAVGIATASLFHLSWSWMLVALSLGFVMLLLQFWRKGSPWFTLGFNVILVGAMWCTMRQQMTEQRIADDSPTLVVRFSKRSSDYVRKCLLDSGLSEENVAVLNAMLLGDREPLTQEQKMRFRGAGVQHLLALSGLHLGIFIAILSFLFLRRARFSRWRWPILIASLILLWSYCLMAGMPQSLLRAMLMTTLFYLNLFATSRSHGSITLANTLLLMLLLDPMSLFDIGTQLSFAAVGALIWLCPVISEIVPYYSFPTSRMGSFLRRLWQLSAVSLSAWFGTMPLCLLYFHQFQPWQPLVSIILVPMTTILLYLGLALLFFCLVNIELVSHSLSFALNWFMGLENAMLDFAGMLPGSTMRVPEIHIGHVLLLYILIFVMGVGMQATRKVQYYCLLEIVGILVLLCLV